MGPSTKHREASDEVVELAQRRAQMGLIERELEPEPIAHPGEVLSLAADGHVTAAVPGHLDHDLPLEGLELRQAPEVLPERWRASRNGGNSNV